MSAARVEIDNGLKRLELGERWIRRNPLYYEPIRRQLTSLDEANAGERRAWVAQRLEHVLAMAARSRYGESVAAPRALREWPLLAKESVRNDPHAFAPRARWGRRLFDARASTGGTTGVPLKLLRSPESIVVEQATQDLAVSALGLDPRRAKVAVLRADSIKDPSDMRPPFWISALGGRRLIFSSNHLSAHTLAFYLDAMRSYEPDVLWVYPTALESFCLLLQRAGERLQIGGVLSSSEVLAPEVWRLAQDTLGSRIVDRYGQAERVACAHASAPAAYRFVPGYAHVELLEDSEDESAVLYQIVGTTLWNDAMPLVRYCTGDLIRLPRSYGARELTEVASGERSFEGVIGRANDVLLAPDGASVLTGVNHIPRDVPHLLRLQVAQEAPDRIVLRALTTSAFSDEDAQRLLRNARLKIPRAAEVRLEVVTRLQRTDRGKTPFVVYAPDVQEALRKAGFRTSAMHSL